MFTPPVIDSGGRADGRVARVARLVDPRDRSREWWVGALGVGAFVLGSAFMVARKGLFIQTDTVFIWVILGLLALSLTDLRRFGPRLLLDWLPLAALFILYDYSRNLAEWLGTPTHMSLQIHFDEFLFGKPLLTIKLQHLLGQTKAVRFWEYGMWGVYMTHFFAGLVVAALLWRFAYPRFRQFRAQLVTLYTLGFLTYALYPADPPWIVSQKLHKLPVIYRTVFEVWTRVGLHTAGSLLEHGNEFGNQLAAVPSMHAAVSLFICLFFWRGARWWLRALLVTYVLAMAFTLVYSGEHYVFDVVVGWAFAIIVIVGAALLRRVRAGEVSPAIVPGHRPALVTTAADRDRPA
jgi:membrane-associated phospholipid phosphatase